MAIYSCNLRSIGKTTHAAGTAGAHARYIGREDAAPVIICEHMPEDPQAARTWLDQQEATDRKNARIIDKIRLALPRELDEAQRGQLVQDYMAEMSGGRVPWYAAIHQTGKDEHNPHAHIIVRDRDIETGKRVMRLSDSSRDWKKAGRPEEAPVQWVRERWEHHANAALELNGHEARIDRRSLEAQGIDRKPTIHVGPQAQHIDTTKGRPESKDVDERSWRRTQYRDKTPYPAIDLGRTRRERNAEIIDFNLEKAARSKDFATRKWAEFEKDQAHADRVLERETVAQARKRAFEDQKVLDRQRAAEADLAKREAFERQFVQQRIAEDRARAEGLAEGRFTAEEAALKADQSRFFAKVMRVVDFTGRTRQAQDQAWAELSATRTAEIAQIKAQAEETRRAQEAAIQARAEAERIEIEARRQADRQALQDRHHEQRQAEEMRLQAREAAREQARRSMETQINTWKQAAPTPQAEARQVSSAQQQPQPSSDPEALRQAEAMRLRRELYDEWKAEAAKKQAQPSNDKGFEPGL